MKRLLSALLAVALLSGCAAAPVKKEKKTPAKPGIYAAAAGLSPDAELLRVDGRRVPAEQYLYWLAAVCGRVSAECGGTPDWQAEQDGKTLAESAKERALRTAAFCAAVESQARKSGCALTDAERASAARQARLRAGALGVEISTAERLCRESRLYEKLSRQRRSETSPAALKAFAAARNLPLKTAWPAYFDAALERTAERVSVETRKSYGTLDAGKFWQKLCALRDKNDKGA